MKEALSYDDVLLVPQYSEIRSRSTIDIGSDPLKIPIISSPMDTVTESDMAIAMANAGGLGVIHRYNSIDKQVQEVRKVKQHTDLVCAAIGISGDYKDRTFELHSAGCNMFCLDVAHGHHVMMKEAIQWIKAIHPDVKIMAGNVATGNGYADLSEWGADYVRCNVGGGSICSTRIQTGHGYPGLQTLFDCYDAKETYGLEAKIIADGGIRNSGDIVKALSAGADFVMVGSLLAGTDEAPGETFIQDGVLKKVYRGMASKEAQQNWKGTYSSFEGVSSTILYRGAVADVLNDLERGIRSGFSYSGANSIHELRQRCVWAKQTGAGQIESSPHILRK